MTCCDFIIPNLVVCVDITLLSSGLIHPTEEQDLLVNSWPTRQMIDKFQIVNKNTVK